MTEYYKRREGTPPVTYGQQYWTAATDPDGNVRDLTKERAQKLDDMRDEITFIRNLPNVSTVLDVGCGLGWFLEAMPKQWLRVGIDTDTYACEQAQSRTHDPQAVSRRNMEERRSEMVVQRPDDGVIIRNGELRGQQYHSDWADVVFCYHVIEHMADPVAEVREMVRILKPGGHLVIGSPDFGSAVAQEYGERFRLLNDRTHVSLFSSWSCAIMLHDFGMDVLDVRYPYFGTRHHSTQNLARLANTKEGVSPAAHGNTFTIYSRKR